MTKTFPVMNGCFLNHSTIFIHGKLFGSHHISRQKLLKNFPLAYIHSSQTFLHVGAAKRRKIKMYESLLILTVEKKVEQAKT